MPLPSPFTLEDQIILASARLEEDGEELVRLRQVSAEIDGERVFAQAEWNRVLPLVYRSLSRCCPEVVAAEVLARMKSRCLQVCAKNLHFVSLLYELLDRFREHGIDCLVVKGPVFTAGVYGDVGLRSYGDLDFLVSRRDLRRAVEVLLSAGFQTDIDLDLDRYEKLAVTGHHATLVREGAVVELHWELSGRYCPKAIELEAVAGRQMAVEVSGREVPTLGVEDLLLYLCIHGSRHYWMQLDAVCCVNELLKRHPRIDWDVVCERSKRWGASRMLLLGLELSRRLFGADLPQQMREQISGQPALQKTAAWCVETMFSSAAIRSEDPCYSDYVRYQYALMDSRLDWLTMCLRPMFRPTHSDWLWLKLPVWLSPLYYLLRPVRLIQKYSSRLVSRKGK